MSYLKIFIDKYRKMSVVVKASLWFVICSVLQKSISFITTPIFARLMTVEQYGYFNTYLSWLQIVAVFCTLNMHSCVYINGLAKNDGTKDNNKMAVSMLSLSFTITVILFVIYLIFREYINDAAGMDTSLFLLMFCEILFQPPLHFWIVKQRFEYKYVGMVLLSLGMTVVNAGLGVLFVINSAENNTAFARILSIAIVQAIIGGTCWLIYTWKAKMIFSVKEWKRALKVQIPLVPHGLSVIVLASSDRIMINSMIGATAAGYYSLAYSIQFIVKSIKDSIVEAVKPWIYLRIKDKRIKEIRDLVYSMVFLVMTLSVIIMTLAPEIVLLMGGKKYLEAVYAIPPVIGSTFFMFVYNICIMFETYHEEVKKISIVSISCAAANIVLNYLFIPVFGYIAAGYTTLFCYIIFCVLHYFIMRGLCIRRYEGTQIFEVKFLVAMSLIVLAINILMVILYGYNLLRYIVLGIAVVIVALQHKRIASIVSIIRHKNIKTDSCGRA